MTKTHDRRRRLLRLRGGLDTREAERLVPSGRVQSLLYYPYYAFRSRARGRGRLLSSIYLMDARTGQLATTDPFGVEEVTVPRRDVLDITFDAAGASKLARRYIPGLSPIDPAVVYKPFFILEEESGCFLLDAASARIHPLSTG